MTNIKIKNPLFIKGYHWEDAIKILTGGEREGLQPYIHHRI